MSFPTTVLREKLLGTGIHRSRGQKNGSVRILQPITGSSLGPKGGGPMAELCDGRAHVGKRDVTVLLSECIPGQR